MRRMIGNALTGLLTRHLARGYHERLHDDITEIRWSRALPRGRKGRAQVLLHFSSHLFKRLLLWKPDPQQITENHDVGLDADHLPARGPGRQHRDRFDEESREDPFLFVDLHANKPARLFELLKPS